MSDARVKAPASSFPRIEKTYGRPICEWPALAREKSDLPHMRVVARLKATHGQGLANAIVAHVRAETQAARGA